MHTTEAATSRLHRGPKKGASYLGIGRHASIPLCPQIPTIEVHEVAEQALAPAKAGCPLGTLVTASWVISMEPGKD